MQAQRGATSIIITFVISIVLISVAMALSFILTSETRELGFRGHERQALYLAQAGVEVATANVQASFEAEYQAYYSIPDALDFLEGLYGETLASDEAFRSGTITVTVTSVEVVYGEYKRNVTFRSTGLVADANKVIEAVVSFGFTDPIVFNHAYFMDNYGWFYGGAHKYNGEVRSNGPIKVVAPQKINGDVYSAQGVDQTQGDFFYDTLQRYYTSGDLSARPADPAAPGGDEWPGGYDGFNDNVDVFGNVRDGADPQVHANEQHVAIPYLRPMGYYEQLASSEGGTVHMGTALTIDGVFNGDVVLFGTQTEPIIINGPVAVTGDVLIKGTVMGQGTIYCARNIHIIDDLVYKNPPAWPKPDNDPVATEVNNQSKDFLALAAKGNVVLGNYYDAVWNDVKPFIKPPFTGAYPVDINDQGIGYVSYYQNGKPYFDGDYTAEDSALRTDGSARKYYESSLTYSQFIATSPTNDINDVNAMIYANHFIGGKAVDLTLNGCLIARDDALAFDNTICVNYDYRIGEVGKDFIDLYLPIMIDSPETLSWTEE